MMALAKRKESHRAIVVKRERHEEKDRCGGEDGRGSSRCRYHHSELLPPPKRSLSAACLVAVPSPWRHRFLSPFDHFSSDRVPEVVAKFGAVGVG
ncbi:hypothetical protein PIB30_004132 [Stylosanthes scabra]|uniref:Uncharacterized protein n=1 Tax=Stylosanthes scabra TaxID=79078 RepID=A0ABU6Q3F7_9FABA|nr:hypothetical protein [Stylosanthes scabra]